MNAAKGLECPRHRKANGYRFVGLLRTRIEVEPGIEDAHIVRARIVVEHCQRLANPEADASGLKRLVGLGDATRVGGRRRRRGLEVAHPSLL